jgi:hypothetical protein
MGTVASDNDRKKKDAPIAKDGSTGGNGRHGDGKRGHLLL